MRPHLAARLGMTLGMYPDDVPHPRIVSIEPSGVAATSGLLRRRDVIVSVQGQVVKNDTQASGRPRVGRAVVIMMASNVDDDGSDGDDGRCWGLGAWAWARA